MGKALSTARGRSTRSTPEFRSKKIKLRRQRKFFRIVAKHAYPRKTAREVRVLTGYSESTIYEWLAGRADAPSTVLMALLGEIAGSP